MRVVLNPQPRERWSKCENQDHTRNDGLFPQRRSIPATAVHSRNGCIIGGTLQSRGNARKLGYPIHGQPRTKTTPNGIEKTKSRTDRERER